MVQVDLNLKDIVGLAELNSIDEKTLRSYLEKFTKEDFINYIISNSIPEDIQEDIAEADDDIL